MAVEYTSTRIPTGFTRNDGQAVANGALASASLSHTIIENQQWLAFGDTDQVNFMVGAPDENVTRVITVRVPPFCQYASFHFHCARDFNGTSTTQSYIDIACTSSSRRTVTIPWGSDLAATGKSMSVDMAGWVHFEGIADNPLTSTPTAIRLLDDSAISGDWSTVNVTVTVSPKVYVYTGAYRVMPPTRVITVQS